MGKHSFSIHHSSFIISEKFRARKQQKREALQLLYMESGSDLSSRAVSSQVLSALKGLTSVFGMGTGGTPSSLPPEIVAMLFRCTLTTAHRMIH